MGDLTGLVAVVTIFGMPTAVLGMYTFYRVRKLRTEERLAAMTRGVAVPMEPDLNESARSRRAGILLIAGAIGYMMTFLIIARVEPDAWVAGAFGAIPLALGLGFFTDSALIRRDARVSN
jgi:CBS domain-containing protein